jgi:hypothetical protein
MREHVPDWPETAGMPQIAPSAEEPKKRSFAFRSWVESETDGNQPGRIFRLKSLWKQKKANDKVSEKSHARAKKVNWVPRAIWMVFLTVLGVVISLVFHWVTKAASWNDQLEFYIVVWTAVIGGLLESAVALFKQWEEKQATEWDLEGATLLDDLSRHNRQLVDSIVRQQCGADLEQQERMINDVRSRVFKDGNEDLALRLRRLEQKLADARGQVLNTLFGAAPYLNKELNINRRAWERMLDDDERLLVQAAALTEDAHHFQERLSKQGLDGGYADKFEEKLDLFVNNFSSRQRALRAGYKDLEPYRIQE